MFDIGDDEITRPGNRPLCLAVGCPEESALSWASSVNDAGFTMRTVSLEESREAVRARRPMVILLTNDVYAFDPAGILAMARAGGAEVMLLRATPSHGPQAISDAERACLRADLETLRGFTSPRDQAARTGDAPEERPTLRSPPPPPRSGLRLPPRTPEVEAHVGR